MSLKRLNVKNHISCLEGDWDQDLRKGLSIKYVLEFIKEVDGLKYIHRHCSTKEEFFHRLKEYKKAKYKDFSIVYLAFHGWPGEIFLGKNADEKNCITLDEIAENCGGYFKDKIVYFGSCLTMKISKMEITNFLEKTGALCVCGYKKSVDIVDSTSFELIFFKACNYYADIDSVYWALKKQYDCFFKVLGFVMYYL